eukprot:TRINITY_DN25294_c0_g2_i1.p1 TRINITY_DN25294_c0_g2~~TRINITY_DN25294_c0_g2_i1.p1  ORF type:complete len:1607 (+),score=365.13 TRINITY_DN25294_c0_g2_i1:131-4951(+)
MASQAQRRSSASRQAAAALSTLLAVRAQRHLGVRPKAADAAAFVELYHSAQCDGYDEEFESCPNLPACQACRPRNCRFSPWADWHTGGGCSGLIFRHRDIDVVNNECGKPCRGDKIEARRHTLDKCVAEPVDCTLSDWSDWTTCSSALDQRYRERGIARAATEEGTPCSSVMKETLPCGNNGPHPRDCVLTDWSRWTDCSASCGSGVHSRMRRIKHDAADAGLPCRGKLMESKVCDAGVCDNSDCRMGAWTEWSACDEYGKGNPQRYRHRQVEKAAEGAGKRCHVPLQETQGCDVAKLDCILSDWKDWADCDQTCGGGQSFRSRSVKRPPFNGGTCYGSILRETKVCNLESCDATTAGDAKLSSWTTWTACSAKCGVGSKTRSRQVTAHASVDGKGFNGQLSELAACKGTECHAVDCAWSEWTPWTSCTLTCGGGYKKRTRSVETTPSQGGKECEPLVKEEVAVCGSESCSTACQDGRWSSWYSWSPCSATVIGGYRSRRRDLLKEATWCGKPAEGLRQEFMLCEGLPDTDQDCEVSSWAQWGDCSSSCFGVRYRNRVIQKAVRGRGRPCPTTPMRETESCHPLAGHDAAADCLPAKKQDCALSAWSDWSQCTRSCGGGQRDRKRHITHPPAHGGKPCDDVISATEACHTQHCEEEKCEDCKWGQWEEWSSCSPCGLPGGQRYRTRVIEQAPNRCGKICDAKASKEMANCTVECAGILYCSWTDWSAYSGCERPCGTDTQMRTRALSFYAASHGGATAFFSGKQGDQCSGTQLDMGLCPATKTCGSSRQACKPRDCAFSAWADWSKPSCDGLCERYRKVDVSNNECGKSCSGVLLETKRCEANCRPKQDCKLGAWHPWSSCEGKGYLAQRQRQRHIEHLPKHGGQPCHGVLTMTEGCANPSPSVDCRLSEWSSWSYCQRSCGGSWQMRERHILVRAHSGGLPCTSSLEELQICNTQPCPSHAKDCEYGLWSSWSSCSDDHQRYRGRVIKSAAQHQGKACEGALHAVESCGTAPVDCEMGQWTTWDACDRSCGGGQKARHRQVNTFPLRGGRACSSELVQTDGCNQVSCPGDCEVGDWSDWATCSAKCGVGQYRRSRQVLRERSPGARGCSMSLEETAKCHGPPCHIQDCLWDEWEPWSGCTRSCGGGQESRTRRIVKNPTHGGKACMPSDKQQVQPCNTQRCGSHICIDGRWEAWSRWSLCSRSCGGGLSTRTRRPEVMANVCGVAAEGKAREVHFCNVGVQCEDSLDCKLAEWGEWTGCSSTCTGVQTRSRHIARYGKGLGNFCTGSLRDTRPCEPGAHSPLCGGEASIDCALSSWSSWTDCSATCDGGEQGRVRQIDEMPQYGGKPCDGGLSEVRECGRSRCHGPTPTNCAFGDWEAWGACSKCGGQRKRFRHVKVYAKHDGKDCDPTDAEETAACPRHCHEHTYCTLGTWEEWGNCSAVCGEGRRSRKRYLEVSDKPGNWTDELFFTRQSRDPSHDVKGNIIMDLNGPGRGSPVAATVSSMPEILTAFLAGCLVFAVGLAFVRVILPQLRGASPARVASQPARSTGHQYDPIDEIDDRVVNSAACLELLTEEFGPQETRPSSEVPRFFRGLDGDEEELTTLIH